MELLHQPEEIISGRYRIIDTLGQGGSGITYLAEDLQNSQKVALKALSLHRMSDWKTIELFEREARVLAQLNHPAIPRYLEYFHVDTPSDRCFYIAQQVVEGKSLATLVQDGWRTSEQEVQNIAIQILEILIYLHSLIPPVVHRDIKPQNIIRNSEGQVFLVDFGAVQDTYYSTFMRGSTVVGTFGYMAPEQFRGQAVPTTDLYGLGATLLFLLSHRSPSEFPTARLKIDFRDRVHISKEFAKWLEKMLEPDVQERFPSAKQALNVLCGKRIKDEEWRITQTKKSVKVLIAATVAQVVIAVAFAFSVFNLFKYPIPNFQGFTPREIHEAAGKGDINTITNYLEQGGNVNGKNEHGQTPLHLALVNNREQLAELLIAKGADVNAKNFRGETPLHWASRYNSKELAELLIAKGADINAKDKNDQTPLHWAAASRYNRNFGRASRYNSKELGELLIAKGADINAKDKNDQTPLDWALRYNNKELVELLIAKGADINTKNQYGQNLLDWALSSNSKEFVELLIAKGADVNAKNFRGETPLHRASQYRSKELAELLIAKGADVNAKNLRDETPLHWASRYNSKELAELLIAKGADINAKDKYSQTPLHLAAASRYNRNFGRASRYNSKELAELLIAKGADINAKDKNDQTPLDWALQYNNKELAELLIVKGVKVNQK